MSPLPFKISTGVHHLARRRLLLSTALIAVTAFASSAHAQSVGGNGGRGNILIIPVSAGGAFGVAGAPGAATGGWAGGGAGGGAGAAGGAGGSGGGAGGSAGTDGSVGTPIGTAGGAGGGFFGGGGGGGGGGNGVRFTTSGAQSLTGGTGGAGGQGGDFSSLGAGGGGGSGGYGIAATGGAIGLIVSGNVTGGDGGRGGNGASQFGSGGGSGSGGSGGGGIYFGSADSTLILNSGTVSGGTGGVAGIGGYGNGTAGNGGNGVDFIASGGAVNVSGGATVQGGNGAVGGVVADGAGGAGIVGSGLSIINNGSIIGGLSGDGVTRANAITFTGGANTLTLSNTAVVTGNIAINNAGTLTFYQGMDVSLANAITGTGSIVKNGVGTLTLAGNNTFSGGTTITFGTLQIGDGGTTGSINGNVTNSGTLAFNRSDRVTFGNVISGTGAFTQGGTGTTVLTGTNTYSGGTTISAGTLQIGNGGTTGTITGNVVNNGTLAFNRSDAVTFAGAISGTGAVRHSGIGTLTLTGIKTYTGATTVDRSTLIVDGSIASSSMTTMNAGSTLAGIGILGNTTINGGTLTPGNSIGTLTVQGSLTMTAASTYLVEISGTASDLTNVTGAAAIGGKVVVNPLARLSATTTYTIINAGTLTGTFDSASITNYFARNARLSYVGSDVLLTLDPGLLSPILPGHATGNQRSVAAGIDNALLANANLPKGFDALFGLTGNNLLNALTQISGETVTGSQQSSFTAANLFMGVMTDPFANGRGDAPGALGFAEESDALAYAAGGRKRTRTERDAFAMFTKAPPKAYEARWNVWAAGFGGSQTTQGNAASGSNDAKSSIYGGAVGADYWFSPFTVAGFSMAGGGTNFSVTGGGSGRSDLFQFGGFVRHTVGSTYITAAAAYGWQDITTDRTVTLAGFDQLRANFNANSYSGRVEVGHRFATPWVGGLGLTPYAAFQVTAFDLPTYTESVVAGSNTFALTYAGKTAMAPRSELGLRTDKSFAVNDAILTLRGRAAWAHDINRDRSASATFQSLPGASFIVNGASLAKHTALTSASAELKWMNGWSVAGTFEGEFSDVTKSYAGKGVVRYAW